MRLCEVVVVRDTSSRAVAQVKATMYVREGARQRSSSNTTILQFNGDSVTFLAGDANYHVVQLVPKKENGYRNYVAVSPRAAYANIANCKSKGN